MHRPRLDHRRRCALAAACFLLPTTPAALATTYNLYSQTIDLATAPYTADDTLNCRYVTFTSSLSSATLPAALNLLSYTTINTSANVTFAGPLSGSASFQKSGTGSLTLTAPSPSFTGSVYASGTLRLTDPTALGPASAPDPITLAGAALDVSGSLPARPVRLWGATLANNTPTPASVGPVLSIVPDPTDSFTLSGTGDLTFSSPFPSAAYFTKTGTGTATYSTPTSFSGGISVDAGTLRLGIESPFAGSAAPLTIDPGGTLDLNGYDSPGASSLILERGGTLANDNTAATSTLATLPTFSTKYSGGYSLGGSGALDLTAPLPATLTFTKVGAGTLTLSADNTSHAGTITVAAGTLRLGNPAGAGNSGTSNPNTVVSLSPGGRFDLNGFAPPRVQVYFNGGALVNDNTSTPVTLSSTSLPSLVTGTGPVSLGGAGEILLTRSLGTYTVVGPGVVTTNRPAGSASAVTINGGTLRLGTAAALLSSSTVTANPGGSFDLNGFPPPPGVTVTLNDGALVNNNTATPVTLNSAPAYAPNSHNPAFGGDGTLNLNSFFFSVPQYSTVHKIGKGLLTIPSQGFYASLSVDAGFVQIESDSQISMNNGNYTTLNGGGIRVGPLMLAPLTTYTLTNDIAINPVGGTIDTEANTVFTGRFITYTHPSGTLTKTGPANLSLNWSGGAFVYNQPITVDQGTLSVNYPAYCLSQTPLTLNADNALTGSTSFTLGALAGTGALNNLSITTGALNLDTTYAGAFTNGSLTTTGTGSLTLTGPVAANSVNVYGSSTLRIGDGHTTGSVAPAIYADSTAQIIFNRSDAVTHTGAFFGSGTLTKLAPSTLTQSTGLLKLNVAAGSLLFAPSLPATPRPFSLTIAPGASLDLTSNSLVLNYAVTSPLPTIRQYLAAHQLFSSTSDADPQHLLTLACAEASALLHLTGSQTASWFGQTVDATSLLLQPALFGDANLDGSITPDDYTLLDRSYARATTNAHWTDGDFNYDGVVDPSDYLLIDTTLGQAQGFSPGFLAQREQQFGAAYVSTLLATVPEPSLLLSSILYLLPSSLLPRRRRYPLKIRRTFQ